jgi:hypothetical protein
MPHARTLLVVLILENPMIEVQADLWSLVPADATVITTNGTIKSNGACVMGRGCAKEARDRFPGIDKILGKSIALIGNIVAPLGVWGIYNIVAFPVKHSWSDEADPKLINKSVLELLVYANFMALESIILPRPGCGNGKLNWGDVKPLLAPLDDRFIVVSK